RGRGFRGGRFYGSRFYRPGFHPGFRRGFFYGGPGYFYGSRFYRRGFLPGDAFLLSSGIIGGAILIDRSLDANGFNDGARSGARSLGGAFPSQNSQRSASADRSADVPPLNGEPEVLLGGFTGNYQAAYQQCVDTLTARLAERDIVVSVPGAPQSGGDLAGGSNAWRFNAEFTTRDPDGASFLRTLTCEVEDAAVSYLEIR
ncbi:MAG: hypothetical protein AAFY32_05200, partial [Pseudomonadota bacterium]